jgi:hypothetical protein
MTRARAEELVLSEDLQIITGELEANVELLDEIVLRRRKDISLSLSPSEIPILSRLPQAERVRVVVSQESDLDVLAIHPRLREVHIRCINARTRPSLEVLTSHLESLDTLALTGTFRRLDLLASMRGLKHLSLVSVPAPDLEAVRALPLEYVFIYGSRSRELSALGALNALRVLHLKKHTEIRSLTFLEHAAALEHVYLEYLSKVEALPAFDRLPRLRRLEVFQCNRLRDIESARRCEAAAVKIWGCSLLPPPYLGYGNAKGLAEWSEPRLE